MSQKTQQVIVWASGTKGVIYLTPGAFQRWNNNPKGGSYPWYGKNNMNLLKAGHYTPAPTTTVMNTISALYSQTKGWNFAIPQTFSWTYAFPSPIIKGLLDWFTTTNIPSPYPEFALTIQKLATSVAVAPDIEMAVIHLIGCCFFAVKEVTEANHQDHQLLWKAYPPDWGLSRHTVAGNYKDIVAIASTLPLLNTTPYPPNDVISILIQFDKETKKDRGELSGKYFAPPPRDDERSNEKVLSTTNKARMTRFFQEVYPTPSQNALRILTQETLPYYQWQGVFIQCYMTRVRQFIPEAQIHNVAAWKPQWPVRDPSTLKVKITFGGFGKNIFPPHFWPIPNAKTLEWLDKLATLPGATLAKGGTFQVGIPDAQSILECSVPNGWLNLPEVGGVNLDNIESPESKRAFEKCLPMIYTYAVALRHFKAGKEDWRWNEQGELPNASPVDRYRLCHENLNRGIEDPINVNCAAEQIKGWEQPWLLSKEDFLVFLKHAAPMPKLREQKSGEKTDEYLQNYNASKGGYQQWFNLIVSNPSVLDKFPIGSKMGVLQNTHPAVEILNLFPNYGLWYSEVEDSILHHLLNPYHDLTGKYLLDELRDFGRQQLDFLRKEFTLTVDEALKNVDNAGKQAANTGKDLFLPVLGFAGVAAGLMITYSLTVK